MEPRANSLNSASLSNSADALDSAHPTESRATSVTQNELEMLTSFFSSDEVPPDTMDLQELDGFLTAIASAPSILMPSMWLPALYGDDEAFADGDRARMPNAVIVRLLNEIADALQRGESFGPLGQPDATDAPRWARGYVAGARLDARWRNDDMGAALLFPLGVLSGLFKLSPEDIAAAGEDRQAELQDHLEVDGDPEHGAPTPYYETLDEATVALYRYWRRHRTRLSGPRRRRVATVHQPCLCGSGAAYSRCCGRQRLS
ncbi:MAG: UPF0149 family protein [Deltaproteobacteria bacterium]|nr:UPF0149 family protein [Deltaproteobacteria bacterium]